MQPTDTHTGSAAKPGSKSQPGHGSCVTLQSLREEDMARDQLLEPELGQGSQRGPNYRKNFTITNQLVPDLKHSFSWGAILLS